MFLRLCKAGFVCEVKLNTQFSNKNLLFFSTSHKSLRWRHECSLYRITTKSYIPFILLWNDFNQASAAWMCPFKVYNLQNTSEEWFVISGLHSFNTHHAPFPHIWNEFPQSMSHRFKVYFLIYKSPQSVSPNVKVNCLKIKKMFLSASFLFESFSWYFETVFNNVGTIQWGIIAALISQYILVCVLKF